MFGQTIHFIRTVKDIKQDEISKKANISQSTYSKFEQNKSDIRSTSFVNILSVLDIPLHEFYFIHNKYKDFLNMQRIYINLQLNIGILCIENNKYEQGLTIIEKSIEPAKKEKAYVQVAIAYVRKGICLKGQLSAHEDGDSWIQKGLNILEILEDRETLALLTNEIDYFLKVSTK